MRARIASAAAAWHVARFAIFFAVPTVTVGSASAQVGETLLLPAVVPPGFNRGNNVSVTELPRPGFEPVGIRLGSFSLLPSLRSSAGTTSNTYFTGDPVASAFLSNTPTTEIISQWSRHQLVLSGTGTFREYIGQSRRNETTWQTDARGRVDLGRFTTVYLEEISSQLTENQFSGETTPTVAALSRYRRDYISARGVNQIGRKRLTLASDYSVFRFQPLPLLTGGTRSQDNRNRNVARITGQFEYAWSPNVAFFAQASLADQTFKTELSPGVPNADATGYRFLGGVNFDDPGFVRGSIGIGYTRQGFHASLYKAAGGLSVQGQLDIFPSRLTTVHLAASRTIEVTNLSAGANAFWSNRASLRVDREVWRRIIIDVTAGFNRQSYVRTNSRTHSYQFGAGAQYVSSRRVVVDAGIDYGNRSSSNTALGSDFDELRGELGITYRI